MSEKQVHKHQYVKPTKAEIDEMHEAAIEQQTRAAEKREHAAEAISDMDDILDEIDLVLEENAQEFVQSYIQAGGQ